jgi:hypothetical protein
MMMRKLKFAAVAAISLLGLLFEVAPATAGGCCGSAVIVQPVLVYPSCSCCGCGAASYGLSYYGGYGGYGPGYYGGYRGGLYRRAAFGGYRGGLYRRAAYGGRGGLYRRGY